MKVVLDANVLVSGLINPNGVPAKIISLVLNGKLMLLYDIRIIGEYADVLNRPKFGFRKSWTKPLLDYIENEGSYVNAEPVEASLVDDDDRAFFEVAKTGKARYLVTGNKSHYPEDTIVQSPKEFIEVYLKETAARPNREAR